MLSPIPFWAKPTLAERATPALEKLHTKTHYFLSGLKKTLLEKDTVFGGLMQSSVGVLGLASEMWAGFLPLLAPLGQMSLHRAPAAPAV